MKSLALLLLLAVPSASLAATPLAQRPASQDEWLKELTVPYAPLRAVMHDSASSVSRLCGAYEEARGLLSKHSKMSTQGDYLVLWSDGDLRSVGIDNEYWAIWKEVNKFKTKCEHYAKVQQKKKEAGMIANRPFKSSAAGFTHFLNNRVNWDGVATVKFDNLGKCYFDSAYAVRCYQGYITIKSRVESKVCYLKEIEWRHSDNRSTYKLGQCGYTL